MIKFPLPCCANCKYVTLSEDQFALGCEKNLDNYRINVSDYIDMNLTEDEFQKITESLVCEGFVDVSLTGIAGPGADQERHKLEAIQRIFTWHLEELVDKGNLKDNQNAPRQRG